MGFFSRNRDATSDGNGEDVAESEMRDIQDELGARHKELDGIAEKILTVKEEYSTTVDSLMSVKKELYQEKMERNVIKQEYDEIVNKIKGIRESDIVSRLEKSQEDLLRTRQELDETRDKYVKIKEQITEEQSTLDDIKRQQIEYGKKLDEASSRLHSAKEELAEMSNSQDTDIITPEKELAEGDSADHKNLSVIEAASAMVGSLKSKLNMAQKEMEALQLLLEKERMDHRKTEQELEELKRRLDQ